MTPAQPRSGAQRKLDTLAKLREPHADVWVASASADAEGSPSAHLVPLSLAWIDDRAVLAVDPESRTARSLQKYGTSRLAAGPTRDVVIIDAVLDRALSAADADAEGIAAAYAEQADWDPRTDSDSTVYLVMRPERIQAWRESNELSGRTLMRGGSWIV